jgi:hypothetical protein
MGQLPALWVVALAAAGLVWATGRTRPRRLPSPDCPPACICQGRPRWRPE